MKLSKTQLSFLEGLEAGRRFLTGKTDILNRTANRLDGLGLVTWKAGHTFGGTWDITDAGRAALKDTTHAE